MGAAGLVASADKGDTGWRRGVLPVQGGKPQWTKDAGPEHTRLRSRESARSRSRRTGRYCANSDAAHNGQVRSPPRSPCSSYERPDERGRVCFHPPRLRPSLRLLGIRLRDGGTLYSRETRKSSGKLPAALATRSSGNPVSGQRGAPGQTTGKARWTRGSRRKASAMARYRGLRTPKDSAAPQSGDLPRWAQQGRGGSGNDKPDGKRDPWRRGGTSVCEEFLCAMAGSHPKSSMASDHDRAVPRFTCVSEKHPLASTQILEEERGQSTRSSIAARHPMMLSSTGTPAPGVF